jgi:DNA repair protein RecO (recombination protein O)
VPVDAHHAQDPQIETVRGRTLLDIAREDYSDATTAAESKRLLRALIHHHFGQPELNTRQLIKDLQQL